MTTQAAHKAVGIPKSQRVRWAPKDGMKPGIKVYTDQEEEQFIPWDELKEEIEQKLFNQLGQHIPVHSTAVLDEFRGREAWLVKIMSPTHQELGHVWFGVDPYRRWQEDGLVRLGTPAVGQETPKVWQVFERKSDGSYHRIQAYI